MPEETVGAVELATCECPTCRKRKGMSHNVHDGVMHEYSSTPRNGWRARRTRGELATVEGLAAPTFGIELETAVAGSRGIRVRDLPGRPVWAGGTRYTTYDPATLADPVYTSEFLAYADGLHRWRARNDAYMMRQYTARTALTAEEAISLAAPRGLWHAKHDGSVTGPEFASQPGTLAYWRAQRGAITGMFKALLHGEVRSHDGDTAGMHVNIGTDAFASAESRARGAYCDAEHLERFMALIGDNRRWAVRMSQRTHGSMSSWAHFGMIGDPVARGIAANRVAAHGSYGTDHSSALNLAHSGRIEFRLPRGTLRVDRFYAKLEWVAAMIKYTRNADADMHVSAFIRWADASGEYPDLCRYMRERFAGRFAVEAVPA